MKTFFLIVSIIVNTSLLFAQKITVAQDGSGNFRTIQEAINSLDTISIKQRTIFIKNGLYPEKLMIGKSYFKLQGQSEKGVVIRI